MSDYTLSILLYIAGWSMIVGGSRAQDTRLLVPTWSWIHERAISLRFLGIILRILRLEVSVYNVYITTSFWLLFLKRWLWKAGRKTLGFCHKYVQEFGLWSCFFFLSIVGSWLSMLGFAYFLYCWCPDLVNMCVSSEGQWMRGCDLYVSLSLAGNY